MHVICFDSRGGPTLNEGITNFHGRMFHGKLDEVKLRSGIYEIVRNAYRESPIVHPLELLMWPKVWKRLEALCRVKRVQPVIDGYVFWVPYELGSIPAHLEKASPWIEKDMARRDRKLLPPAKAWRHSYVAVEPEVEVDVDAGHTSMLSCVTPGRDDLSIEAIVVDQRLIDDLGIVSTWFGYQVSAAVWRILKPLLPWPYFRWLRLQVPEPCYTGPIEAWLQAGPAGEEVPADAELMDPDTARRVDAERGAAAALSVDLDALGSLDRLANGDEDSRGWLVAAFGTCCGMEPFARKATCVEFFSAVASIAHRVRAGKPVEADEFMNVISGPLYTRMRDDLIDAVSREAGSADAEDVDIVKSNLERITKRLRSVAAATGRVVQQ